MTEKTDYKQAYWIPGREAWDEAHEYWAGNWPKAYSTGWPAVDEFYKVAPGQMTVVGGIPNHGKSTFLDALLVNLVHLHKFKVAVYSPENHPLGIHAWHLCEKYIGKPMLPNHFGDRITETEMVAAGLWMENHFRFLTPGTINVPGVLEAANAAFEAEPFDVLALDPWNEIEARPSEVSETEWVSICLGQFRRWAREKQVHLFLVVHPRKLEKGKDGTYPVPTAWDLAGSAHWRNKADNILTFWRDLSVEGSTSELHIQKIRFGYIGRVPTEPIQMQFHPGAKTFTACNDYNAGRYWQAPYVLEKKNGNA